MKLEKIYDYEGKLMFFKSVIYGPLIEEIIYRMIIFEIFKQGNYSNLYSNLITSFIFGLSKFFPFKKRSFKAFV